MMTTLELSNLKRGNEIKATDGMVYTLLGISNSKAQMMIGLKFYTMPVAMFKEVVSEKTMPFDAVSFDDLKFGDMIELANGNIVKFTEKARTTFVVETKNGLHYKYSNSIFSKVIKKANTPDGEWYRNIKKGDYFYIVKGKNCLVYKFEKFDKGSIIGFTVNTNIKTIIDSSFDGGILKVK